MTFEAEQEGLPQVCPYLGLADDADSHATYATEAHRCYRLPTPTRIATNYQENYCLGDSFETCSVYQGESVSKTTTPAPPPATPRQGQAAGRPVRVQGPPPGAGARQRPPRPERPLRPGGTVGPRPRAGGISMPVATVGLFALAFAVIAIALLISRAVDDSDNSKAYDPGVLATTSAQKTVQAGKSPAGQTTQAGSQGTIPPPGSLTPGTPTTPGTPGATRTGTPGTPGATGKTYTVKAGDTCGGIAAASNTTLKELLDLNNLKEDDCTRLQVGQSLKLP